MNCTAVRVRAGVEFDIDIQHHWCWLKWRWLKWWDSLRCSPVPVVEPRERCERAYGYEHKGHLPPLIEADVLIEPPKQHPTANAEPDRASDELKLAQVDDCFEPRPQGEAKSEPKEQNYRNENRSYETHCFTDTACCTSDTRRSCRST